MESVINLGDKVRQQCLSGVFLYNNNILYVDIDTSKRFFTNITAKDTKMTTENSASNCISNNIKQQNSDDLISEVSSIDSLELIARRKLGKTVYDYYARGADEEITLRLNRRMISAQYYLRPRGMVDVSNVNLTKYIFGDKIAFPIGLSPTAMHKLANKQDGELATIRACKTSNTLMILSLFSTVSLEDIAREAPACTKWQNVYILKDREMTRNIINRAKRQGYRAIVVTCDAASLGKRRSDEQNKLNLGEFKLENLDDLRSMPMKDHASLIFDPSVTWQDLADIKKYVGDTMRVVAKGIMTPEDAEAALQAGVDAIFVSNHGGRQLDGILSTIEALPDIVKVVGRRCPVFVDGGFRTGGDVLKALALGADIVFIGRPVLWGLGAGGEAGVARVLEILADELKRAMMLCGCTDVDAIDSKIVAQRTWNSVSMQATFEQMVIGDKMSD